MSRRMSLLGTFIQLSSVHYTVRHLLRLRVWVVSPARLFLLRNLQGVLMCFASVFGIRYEYTV